MSAWQLVSLLRKEKGGAGWKREARRKGTSEGCMPLCAHTHAYSLSLTHTRTYTPHVQIRPFCHPHTLHERVQRIVPKGVSMRHTVLRRHMKAHLYTHVPIKIVGFFPHRLKCVRCGLVLLSNCLLRATYWVDFVPVHLKVKWNRNMQFRARNQCRGVEKPVRKQIRWNMCSVSAFDKRSKIIQIQWLMF